MMKLCVLLMIAVNGMTAIQSEKSPPVSASINYTAADDRNQNRIKRDDGNAVTLRGVGADSVILDYPKTASNFLRTFVGFDPNFYYTKFQITRDLNCTTWEEFLSKYNYAELNRKIHIIFYRTDRQGDEYNLRILPQRINLRENIYYSQRDIEEFYDTSSTAILPKGPHTSSYVESRSYEASPFFAYRQVIFDESIWIGLSKMNAQIWLSMNGFIKDNQLILQLIYQIQLSMTFTTEGANIEMYAPDEIVIK